MTTVSAEGLRAYIEQFHRSYCDAVERYLPADLHRYLERYPYLPTGVVGYISTKFGAGYEYRDDTDGIRVVTGSRSVEELLFDPPRKVRVSAPFFRVGGTIRHYDGRFRGALPFRLADEDTWLSLIDIRAEARGWSRVVSFAELSGRRSAEHWSSQVAIERAMAEVLASVVGIREMERSGLDLSDYLRGPRERHVLLLGSFGDRSRLNTFGRLVRRLGYTPFTLDDVSDIPDLDLRQKALALALLCRFVLIEDSLAAGQLTEIPVVVDQARRVSIVLRHREQQSSWMTRPLSLTSNVVAEFEYDDDDLAAVVARGVDWAEERLQYLGAALDSTYPWRKSDST